MIRVLIVDEVRLMCDAMASVLDEEPDIQVVGCATSVSEGVANAKECEVVLVNANLPDDGAYRLTRTLVSGIERVGKKVQPRVLVLGLVESKTAILRWIEAGARGYVRSEASIEELLENVRSVSKGNAHVTPEIAGALVKRLAEFASWFDDIETGPVELASLTPREMEVLKLLSCDFSNQEIADHLVVEVGTVKNHVHNILTKLNVSNRQVAAMCLAATRGRPRPAPLRINAGHARVIAA